MKYYKDINCVLLGSYGVGKTKLVTNIHGPQKELAEYLIDCEYYTLNFHFIDLNLINGKEEFHLPFEGEPEVVIYMFSLISSVSFSDVVNTWCNILPKYEKTKYILLGTKVDKRKEDEKKHIRYFDGLRMSKELMCAKYMECDFTMGDGIKVLHMVKNLLLADHSNEAKKIKKKCIIM